ncbi:MAG: polymerase beta subunit [Pseudomonadota bacterium]|jgi:DNA polymerase-3 subunit beta
MILIKATRDAILRPLQQVAGIVEKRHTLPILSNLLITKQGQRVSFISTDIEMQITASAAIGAGAEDESTTVSARKLVDILKALPSNDEVTIALAAQKLSITQNRSKFSLQTLPASEFPTVVRSEQFPARVQLTQKDVKRLLHLVSFSMAQQDIRYYLNGMLIVVDKTHLKAVATDGHRLAFTEINIAAEEKIRLAKQAEKIEVIIPRKAISELQKTLKDDDQEVTIEIASNQARFILDDLEILSKLIEGRFPDYQRVIPQNHNKKIDFQRELLLGALARVAILTSDKFKGVRLILSTDQLRISSTNAEQEEAQEDLPIAYAGETLDIGFNVQYLIEVLTTLHSDSVCLSLLDQNSSALLTTPTDPEFRYVVMPMRI